MREAVSLPALDYAGAVSECALRREGEGRSPMDPLRVTGSVGRGSWPPALRDAGLVRAGNQGQPCGPGPDGTLRPGIAGSAPWGGGSAAPVKGGATFPRGTEG